MNKRIFVLLLLGLLLAMVVAGSGAAPAQAQAPTNWKLVNPEGVVVVKPVEIAPRINTLEGKTVALYWNGKHNGDKNLNRIAELLTQQVKGVNIVKVWEKNPETVGISGTAEKSAAKAKTIASFKPDLVIASQAD